MKVVQFNMLSPPLANKKYFPRCTNAALNPELRWKLVIDILTTEIKKGSIICLQEISQEWLGRLITFFFGRNYLLVHRLYGSYFNGYMGIGIAFPIHEYNLLDCNIVQLSDRIKRVQKDSSNYWGDYLWNWIPQSLGGNWGKNPNEIEDQWEIARWKKNTQIMIKMCRIAGAGADRKEFVVATYHMPCDFLRPTVMALHTSIAINAAQEFAGQLPLIFAADWNFKPNSPFYELVTKGKLPADFKLQKSATAVKEETWSLNVIKPMISAYVAKNGREPRFTNYAFTEFSNGVFADTIDYIFLSIEGWNVIACDPLPDDEPQNVFATPLPTVEHPSDHLVLGVQII